jgi:hypothetical protein
MLASQLESQCFADEHPWSRLAGILDDTWMLHVEPSLAMAQVVERQVRIGNSRLAAAERVGNNDLRNCDDILATSRRPDFMTDSSAAHAADLHGENFDLESFRERRADVPTLA